MKAGKSLTKDWRRVTHSAKVGLALALVSLCVLLQDVFDKLGHNALWAILTVVVIFEYSVGMSATYSRFVPTVKAKYDYGVMIFLLTFCLVVISGYQVSDNIDVVFDRIVTVLVGIILCLLISIFIFPVWAGDDLHQLVINNFQGLASSLEECLKEYFQGVQKLSRVSSKICKGQPFDDKIYKGYRGILISKQSEEALGNFASWEPRRLQFGRLYPWKRLVELGAILRHCAYTVSALHGCVLSEIQAPESLKKVFASSCIKIGEEVACVLRGAADDLKAKQKTKPKQILLRKVQLAIEDLNYMVRTYPHFYTLHLQHRNANYSNCAPYSNSSMNPMYSPQEAPPIRSCDHPPMMSAHCNAHAYSHTDSIPNASMHVNLNVPIPSNPNDHILSLNHNSNFQVGKDSLTANGLPPSPAENSRKDNKECFMLHESMEFAESLSLASLVTLLIEIVARVEHLLDAIDIFQERAGFKQPANEEVPFVDTKVEVHEDCSSALKHPVSTNIE